MSKYDNATKGVYDRVDLPPKAEGYTVVSKDNRRVEAVIIVTAFSSRSSTYVLAKTLIRNHFDP